MIKREKKFIKNCVPLFAFFFVVNSVPTSVLSLEDTTNLKQPLINQDSNLNDNNSYTAVNSSIDSLPAIIAESALNDSITNNAKSINELNTNEEFGINTLNSSSANVNYSIEGDAQVGNTVSICINANSVSGLYGASIDFLYDTSLLQIESVSQGSIFAGKISKPLISIIENGQVNVAMSLTGAATPISGSGTIAIIKAKILKEGTINLKTTNEYSKLSLDNYTTCIKLSTNNGSKIGYEYADKTIPIKKYPLDPGTYQENNGNLTYTGSWNSLSSSNYNGGSLKLSTSANSTMEFSFNGTSFELYGTKAISRGKFKVTIDGVDIETVDAYKSSTSYTQLLYKSPEYTDGKHTVKITVLNSKNSAATAIGLDIDKITINKNLVPTETLSAGVYQENDSKLLYTGSWSSLSSSNYSGGSLKLSNTVDSSMSFAFNGTSFELYGTKAISRGKFKVTIDGVDIETVDAYKSSTSYTQLLYKSSELKSGKHIVKITILDSKNSAATSIGLDIDKLTINNDVVPTETLSKGTYQENNSKLIYTGNWNSLSSSNYDGGTLKLSTSANSTMIFAFDGTSFELYGTKAISRGKFKVTIDGIDMTTVDAYKSSTSYTQQLYKSPELDSGKHIVKITVLDTKNSSATAFGLDIDKVIINDTSINNILSPGSYEETNSKLEYTGSWNTLSSTNYSGGSLKISTAANSTMSFTFTGTSFELYGTKAISRGNFKVNIDGKEITTVDAYKSSTSYTQQLYKSAELEYGNHTVQITVLNTKNSAATAIGLDIDKLVINNTPVNGVFNPGTYQDNDSNIKFNGNWQTYSSNNYDGGTLKLTTAANSTVNFAFKGTSFELYGTKAISRGNFKVNIDGVDVATVDGYRSSTAYTQLLYKSSELAYGEHKVTITVLDSKNSAATAIGLDIDKISINSIRTTTPLGIGSYQENNINIQYTGTWNSLSTGNYDGGSLKLTTLAGSTMNFAFNGTSFELYGTKAISRGKFKVSIDGKEITTVDAYNSSTLYTQLLYKSPELNSGDHTVTITVLNEKNSASTAIGLDIDKLIINNIVADNVLQVGTHQDNNANLKYTGTWSLLSNSKYDGGSLKLSTTAGSTASFVFNGTSFELYGTKAISRGKFKISIDGKDVTTVDAYNSSTIYTQLLYKSSQLSSGNHTVTITVLNEKNSAATAIGLDIDKVIVQN